MESASCDVYLAYDPGVAERVRPLAEALRARGISVSPAQVAAPARYDGGLAEEIRRCKALVVALTQDTCGGNWIRLDLSLALGLGKPVLGVVLDPPPHITLPGGLSADDCVYWSASEQGSSLAVAQALGELTGGAVGAPGHAQPDEPSARTAALPFRAYRSDDGPQGEMKPYIFVSYAHLDREQVYADIERLHDEGHRIWYDEGIRGGADWADTLAWAIENATQFLLFLSPRSMASENVLDEIHWARESRVPIVPLWLEAVALPRSLGFRLGRQHGIEKFRMEPDQYRDALDDALEPATRRGSAAAAPARPAAAEAELEPRGGELELSYLLTYSVDGGESWRPLDPSGGPSVVPADAWLRAMVRSSVPCRAALLVETDEPGQPSAQTAVFFAEPRDVPGPTADWRLIAPMKWHAIPRKQALWEKTPWQVRCWRLGVLAQASPGAAVGERLPREPGLAVAAAGRAAAPVPCALEAMGRIQRTRYKLQGDRVPVSVLRGEGALVHWAEVRFG